jgi:hypothetical protein
VSYFSDLTPYVYCGCPHNTTHSCGLGSGPALNVGWLDRDHHFAEGAVPQPFREGLLALCVTQPWHETRGWCHCDLCFAAGNRTYPIEVETPEGALALGDAEIVVVDRSGTQYIAPNMIYHYVVGHDYRPPEVFIRALMDS